MSEDPKPTGDDIAKLRAAFSLFMKYFPLLVAAAAGLQGYINKGDSDKKTADVEQKVENKGAQVLAKVQENVVAPTVARTLSAEERLTQLEETSKTTLQLLKDLAKRSSATRRSKLIENVDDRVETNLKALNARTATNVPPIKPLPAVLPPVSSAPPSVPAGGIAGQ